jgi:hypothetical protein
MQAFFYGSIVLLRLLDALYGAAGSASTAIDTHIGIDYIAITTIGDGAHGAASSTSAAQDTTGSNFVGHG